MNSSVDERLADLEGRVRALESGPPVVGRVPPASTPKQTPREFLLEKGPKSDNDKALAAGYYLELVSGEESFSAEQIEAFFGKAKESAPANRSDPPYQNVKKGYFREVGERQLGKGARNKWALTNSGIARVESGFGRRGHP
jgi:hypothetical protein